MNQYVLSVAAALDLDEIWDFFAQDNIDAADRWINKLFDAFTSLAHAPGMGHKRRPHGLPNPVLAGRSIPDPLSGAGRADRDRGGDSGRP